MPLRNTITLLNLGLLTIAAYLGVGIFYQIAGARFYPPDGDPALQQNATALMPLEAQALNHFQPIVERDLFDTVKALQVPQVESEINVEELKQTELKLKLWGTVSGDDERAYAVIEDTQKREQNLYRIGDTIQNASIRKIMRGMVVLSLNDNDEILSMEEQQQAVVRPTQPVASPASRFDGPPQTQPVVGTQRVSLRRDMINEAMQDISKLMTEIVIQPHVVDGQPAGLALNNIRPNSIFRRMGLRNGDVLKGVNGSEIRSVEDALQLYESLKAADSVQVQIDRRGQERTIDYNIQ